MKTTALLTVAIPTYNRPKELRATLERLLPQLTDECFLLIIDNHSALPVAGEVKDLFEKHPTVKYEIRRNRVNIGGDANIMRCFEYCETKWLWTLGDDDEVSENAIEIILSDVKRNPDVLYINYYSPCPLHPRRVASKLTVGRKEFLENMDLLAASMFISANVNNVGNFSEDSYWATRYTYSCASQVVIILFNLKEDSKAIFSDKVVCAGGSVPNPGGHTNVNLVQLRGLATLLDLPFDPPTKKLVASKLKDVALNWIRIEAVVKSLLVDYYNSGKVVKVVSEYRRFHRIFFGQLGIALYVRSVFWLTLLTLSKKLTFQLIRIGYLRKRGIDIRNWLSGGR